MDWCDQDIPNDDNGHPMFKGSVGLFSEKDGLIGSICWFMDGGPFYAHAMDIKDTTVIRRIGPCTTLDDAKENVRMALSGELDISNRAGYERC